ncbi:MAG: exonuclease domain-containing protein [Oscillospiraceae bacterium]
MNYIILDMEWNQAQGRTKMVQSPVLLRGEIIQIGAVKTDEKFNFIDKIKISVCPKYYKVMNRHVEKITGITSTQLTFGERFPQAFKRFSAWCGEDFRFITWGFDDISILSDNLELYGLDPAWGRDYINLQLIYKAQVDGERLQCSLSDAVERLGIPMDAQAHDAMNDAWFTYEVCTKLDMERGLAAYGELSAGVRVALRKDVIKNVAECRKMLEDARVRDTVCPSCANILKPREWIYYGGGKKTTIAACPEHGDFLIRLTCRKMTEDNWTVSRTIFEADDEALASYEKKLEKQKNAKKRHQEKESTDDNNCSV